MRSWMLVGVATLFLIAPARAGEVTDPEWLAVRLLTASPAELAEALVAYEQLEDAGQAQVRDLLQRAEHRPARLADHLIDLALASTGEPRQRLLGALDALGEPAMKRFLERVKDGPVRVMQSEPSATERTVTVEETPGLLADGERALIQLECHWLETDAGILSELLGSAGPTPDQPQQRIDEAQALALLARDGQGVRILHAPRLTTFDRQPTNVSVTNEVTYVRDYEAKKDAEGNVILDPVVDSIKEGLVVDVSPSLTGERIHVEVRTTVADLSRPIPEFSTVYEGQTARIQVPELHVSRVRALLDLPDGGYALVGGFGPSDESARVLLLKAEKVKVTPR